MNKRGERGKSAASLRIIEQAQAIVTERAPITVRGICYGLFVRGVIPEMSKNQVGRVGKLLVYARENGDIDWEDIVDESRSVERAPMWEDLAEYAKTIARSFRRDFWLDQPHCIQVWSEKATVGGILRSVTERYGVPFLAVHGFGSATSLHDAAKASAVDRRESVIIYVGDHDPSGCHMSDVDLPDRFARYGGEVTIRRVALIEADLSGLPSFPAKPTDPRFKWYQARYGNRAWELDAMNPNILRDRVAEAILEYIDTEAWDRAQLVEAAERKTVEQVALAMAG